MSNVQAYELGSTVRIGPESFKDLSGTLVDLTAIALSIKKPDGTVDGPYAYPGTISKDSTGIYYYDYTPAAAGHYLARWTSTGTQAAAVVAFDVRDSFAVVVPLTGAKQRCLAGSPATLRVTLADQDGIAADAVGAVTVQVTRADGTLLLAAGTATVHGTIGNYSVQLTAAQTQQLDELTAVWTDAGDSSTTTTKHEIVGGFLFSIADARQSNAGLLADPVDYPDAQILSRRREVEDEAEEICDVAFVPRYARWTGNGDGSRTVLLPFNRIRRIRSVRIYTSAGSANYTALTAGQLAGLLVSASGTLERTDGGSFDLGRGNVVVELEHGYDQPPADLRDAALIRLRHRLNQARTGVAERATSFTGENGQTYQIATADIYKTGIPDVDAVYARYSERGMTGGAGAGGKGRAVSLPLNYDPQRGSVFHGGIR